MSNPKSHASGQSNRCQHRFYIDAFADSHVVTCSDSYSLYFYTDLATITTTGTLENGNLWHNDKP